MLADRCDDTTDMPRRVPDGMLLTNLKNTNNDHASVECKRVDCLEASIRTLTGRRVG